MTQTGLQRLFLHKLQGNYMCSQTWSYLRSFEISLYSTPSWTVIFTLKLIREVSFTGFPALKGAVYFPETEVGPFPGSPLWSQPAVWAAVGLVMPSWEGTWCQGGRVCKPLWGWGSWHHRICGSGAGCQATRAPFFFWKKPRFLNTKILH